MGHETIPQACKCPVIFFVLQRFTPIICSRELPLQNVNDNEIWVRALNSPCKITLRLQQLILIVIHFSLLSKTSCITRK